VNFYVATKFENRARYREVVDKLTNAGHHLTHDWTNPILSKNQDAEECFKGVVNADFLVGIFEESLKYQGALVEVGIALALGKHVIILGDWLDSCIFMNLHGVQRVKTIEELLEETHRYLMSLPHG
jgi:nucleoside 2-deoxyribosyltransferase